MVVDSESFFVLGIEARTTNSAEMSGGGVIPNLWARYLSETSPTAETYADTYVVYSGYETDENGPYTYLIGSRVVRPVSVPAGMVLREVLAGPYQVISSQRGPLPQVVPQVWQRIWAEVTGRRYATDYELYDTRASNPQDAQVDVYVGLKQPEIR